MANTLWQREVNAAQDAVARLVKEVASIQAGDDLQRATHELETIQGEKTIAIEERNELRAETDSISNSFSNEKSAAIKELDELRAKTQAERRSLDLEADKLKGLRVEVDAVNDRNKARVEADRLNRETTTFRLFATAASDSGISSTQAPNGGQEARD